MVFSFSFLTSQAGNSSLHSCATVRWQFKTKHFLAKFEERTEKKKRERKKESLGHLSVLRGGRRKGKRKVESEHRRGGQREGEKGEKQIKEQKVEC